MQPKNLRASRKESSVLGKLSKARVKHPTLFVLGFIFMGLSFPLMLAPHLASSREPSAPMCSPTDTSQPCEPDRAHAKMLSHVKPFVTMWTIAHQAHLSMTFSKEEYWNGLPFPSPGDLPHPGIEPGSPALQADSLSTEPPGKPPFIECLGHARCCARHILQILSSSWGSHIMADGFPASTVRWREWRLSV